MAMFAPIPLPGIDNPQFKDVMDYFETLKERKMKEPLFAAQTQEAKANAMKSQMIANLINVAFGGGGTSISQPSGQSGEEFGAVNQATPEQVAQIAQNGNGMGNIPQGQGYQPTPQEQQKINNMQPGDSMVVGAGQQSGMGISPQSQGQPTSAQQKARDMLYSLGILKENPADQEAREKRTAYQKELGASDVKSLEKWNDILTTNSQITPVLENIQEISANPAFQSMYKNPEYFGYDLAYLKRFGTPEQQTLLTSLGTNAKSIFQAMGQEFKGAFREFEMNLFNKAAPDEINDTIQQIVAKTNTMMALRSLVSKRLSLANNIVRSSAGQISPASALEIADRQINGNQVRKQIAEHFKQLEMEQKSAKSNRQDKTIKSPVNAEVEIYSPQGKLVARGSKKDAAKFLKDHKGYYQKVLSNG